jgi:hypothetical protein
VPYTAPTAQDLRAKFPTFAGVDDAVIAEALADAARVVDESWTEDDFRTGRLLYAAHTLTLDGYGGSADVAGYQAAGVRSLSSGQLSVSFGDSVANGSTLGTTSFGRRYLELASRNVGGPLVI